MARRHANGEGSVYRRKDGRWEGIIYVLTTSGIRRRRSVYGKTRAEVHSKLTELKTKQQQGVPVPDKTWRAGEYLDYWLEEVVKPSRRPTTYELYESKIRLYLKPEIGHYRLSALTVPTVQSYLNRHLTIGKTKRHAQMLREILSSALTSAMRRELIGRNVARLVELPGRSRSKIIRPWNFEQATFFLSSTKDHWFHAAFVLLLVYGLRRGELLGLRWDDVRLSQNQMSIEQQVYRANRTVSEGPLKTTASRRKLPLVRLAKEALVAHRAKQENVRSHLVFTAPKDGCIVTPQSFTRAFQRACANVGLQPTGPHTMRHTTATLLKNLGVPARDAQLILGHSNIVTTQQIYQHDDMTSRREWLERLEVQFDRNGVADGNEEPPLPSKPPSDVVLRLDRTQEKTPDGRLDLYKFYGDLTGNRTPIARMKNTSYSPVMARISEVDDVVQTWRRTWVLGCVAVNLAVKLVRCRRRSSSGSP